MVKHLYSRSQMEQSNCLEDLNPGPPRPRRRTRNLLGQSYGSSPTPEQDSSPDDGEARNDFWSISGNYIYRHHVEPRVNLYVPREDSLPIPLRYIEVTRVTSTTLDVMLERRIDDHWNIEGDRELSDSWTGFTRFTLLEEKSPNGCTWCGWRLAKSKQHPGQITRGQKYGNICQMQLNAEKKSGLSKNRNSTMPEDCVVFSSLNLMMKNSSV